MNKLPRVLVIDDEPHILKTIGICLRSVSSETCLLSNPAQAIEKTRDFKPNLAFIDLKMEPVSGLELLKEMNSKFPTVTCVIITAHGTVESAVEALQEGAYNYLQKPFDCKELQVSVQKTWEYHQLKHEVVNLRKMLADTASGYNGIVTRNREMKEILEVAEKISPHPVSILIEGESGTGKELLANFIHKKSRRSGKQMVRVNCGAIPENLIESELFGHVKGAFTGAVNDREGRFEKADGGTIFLDEIGELPPSAQVKLLRVLQQKEYERVGESKTRTTDVRIITATNRNLDDAIENGAFRKDLFYRINGIRLKLPPLRERPEDIPFLIQYILQNSYPEEKYELDPKVLKAMKSYSWPGNIRELENALERSVLLSSNGEIHFIHLPEEIRTAFEHPDHHLRSLVAIEKAHIKRVLTQCETQKEAADILKIDTTTLWRKRKKYNIL